MEIYKCMTNCITIEKEPECISIKKINHNNNLKGRQIETTTYNYNMIDYTKYFIELHYENFIFENGYINFAIFDNIKDIESYIREVICVEKDIDKIIFTSEVNFNADGFYIGNIPHIVDYKEQNNEKIAICSLIGYCNSTNKNIKDLLKYQKELKSLISNQTKKLNQNIITELKRLVKYSLFDYLTLEEINYILKYNFDFYTTKQVTPIYKNLLIEYQKKYNYEMNNLNNYLIISTNSNKSEYYGRYEGLKITYTNLDILKEFYTIYNFDYIITLNMYDNGYEYKLDKEKFVETQKFFNLSKI